MIGIRAAASGVLAAAVCGGGVHGGDQGPAIRLVADRLVVARAVDAEAALGDLERALVPAVETARRGAARIVAGDVSPADPLLRAAAAVEGAEGPAAEVRTALARLDAARRAREPSAPTAVDAPLVAGELSSIADQLEATAQAGEDFAAMRRRADEVTRALEAALVALEDGDLAAAEVAVDAARRNHVAIAAWEVGLVTLPVWVETTDAMIAAMEAIVNATRAGNAEAAREAAEAFAALDEEAGVAERALRIAVSEGGAAVAAVALGRLADALASVREARAQMAAILQTEGR